MNRLFRCFTIIFLLTATLSAEPALYVDYYGTVSHSTDANMIKMAQDLFYSQLKSIENVTVTDMRNGSVYSDSADLSFSSTAEGHIVFYAEISEKDENGSLWNCTLYAIDPSHNKKVSENEIYDSYYKILISAKSAIENVLKKIMIPSTSDSGRKTTDIAAAKLNEISTDSLAGTWNGEPDTNKIVILRGGRGFVIFKNGASMTINVTVESTDGIQTVQIRQNGKPNASYYPSLPRKTALEAAKDAEPITWSMVFTSTNTLSGTKNTLVESSDDPSVAVKGTETVTWKKK